MIINNDNEKLAFEKPVKINNLVINGDNCIIKGIKSESFEVIDSIVINGDCATLENIVILKDCVINGDCNKIQGNVTIVDNVVLNGDVNEISSDVILREESEIIDNGDLNSVPDSGRKFNIGATKVQSFGSISVNIGSDVIVNQSCVGRSVHSVNVGSGIINIDGKCYRGNVMCNKGGKIYIDSVPLEECKPLD